MPQDKRQRQKAGKAARKEQIRLAQQRRRRKNRIIALLILVGLMGSLFAAIALIGGNDDDTDVASDGTTTTEPKTVDTAKAVKPECPKGDVKQTTQFTEAPPMCIDPAKTYTALVSTTEGDFEIALDTKKTPNTVNNFVFLSRYKYYDDTTIFRIDQSIDILQSGSPHTESPGDPGPGYNIKDEGKGFQYTEGDVVMARSQGADSASAQYFFVYGPKAAGLNGQGTYVTFGKVSGAGLDLLKKIGGLYRECTQEESQSGSCLGGKPSRDVTIKSITIKES